MKNKTVFITGASSGIGAALAREFSQKKANLVLTARRKDRLDELAQELKNNSPKVLTFQCDVTKEIDLSTSVQSTLEQLGKIDIVIANAGFGIAGPISQITLDDYRRQFETNVFGVLKTIYATRDALKKTKGTLVLLGSVAGYIAIPGSSAYSMSKFAIHALAGAIRPELEALGISVVLIAPGFVKSEIRHVDNAGKYQPHSKDFVPSWLVMPTEKAARQMTHAILKKNAETIITQHGKFLVFIRRHFPYLLDWAVAGGLKSRSEPKAIQ